MNPNPRTNLAYEYYTRSRVWPSLFNIRPNTKILDIGCGGGVLGKYLQEKYQCKVTGIDIVPENVLLASSVLDQSLLGDIESMDITILGKEYDYIIFSDSLEHLLEPQKILESARSLLAENGKLLISIPNTRNFRVTVPLLLFDQWEYRDEGLLDRTHLRFFTYTSIRQLLSQCGYQVELMYYNLSMPSKATILNRITFGVFKRILTSHYFIQACLKKY